MQKHPNRLWICAIFTAWLFDFLFYKHAPGISFAIYALATLAAGFILLWFSGIRPSGSSIILLPLILFFAAVTFIRMEPLTVFLAHAFTIFLMAGLVVTYRGGQWLRYGLADYFSRGFDLLASAFVRTASFAADVSRIKREDPARDVPKETSPLLPVLRGALIAIPVVVFFAALLSAADLVFAERLNSIVSVFRLENLPEYIFRVVYIAILAYILAGVYLHAANRSTDEKLLGLEKPLVAPFFGFTEASVVLGSVVLLFASFVFIQFQYFFGGQANIHLNGFTYAEYARKGFGELVMVAFFALLLFLGLTAVVRRQNIAQRRAFSALGFTLLALVAVMLVSAYQRLTLYESVYGFTRLRTYTHIFMVWVAVLLAAVVILDLLERQRVFALAALFAVLGFVISLSLLNVDGFILQRNLARFEQGHDLDVGYLATLSSDAIPGMVQLYASPATNVDTRDRLGAALACFLHQGSFSQPGQDWQSFHMSAYWASNSLHQVADSLNTYKIDSSNWPASVTTPLNQKYNCNTDVYE